MANRRKVNEKGFVEDALLDQLDGLGWTIIRAKGMGEGVQYPEDTFRTDFTEVILRPKLEEALKKINPFLQPDQINEAIRILTAHTAGTLLENNQAVLQKLLENTSVSENRITKEKSPTVRFIDFENIANNSFYAVAQFKIRILGTDKHIYPDVTLFLNGLPIAVIECKSPKTNDPIGEAIKDLLVYSEQAEDGSGGNKELFYYNQMVVATCRSDARFGTISTKNKKHFYKWSDPYPLTVEDIATGKSAPNDQQRLVAGMFAKRNLLDLLKSFIIFKAEESKVIKVVGRYQQFRAVKKIIENLKTGKNPDERSGIIWHTQGSGKSLTMMFLVREMKKDDELKKWKIVFVTDRTNLEKQLAGTSSAIGYNVKVANKIKKMWEYMPTDSADIIMAMIHKFQERDEIKTAIIDELNPSERILIMTDEAHRSQYSILKANLNKALPNATNLGFTGTPIEKTEKEFGDYIDQYTMRTAIDDGVTLEIVYEGRTHHAEVDDKEGMNTKFFDVFKDYSAEELKQIVGYTSKRTYLEAWETVRAKAKDMVRHYTHQVFPNGFKAQIVAVSREAAYRYKTAIEEAIKEQVEALRKDNPHSIDIDLLEALETDVIISGGGKKDPDYILPFTDEKTHDKSVSRFKMAFDEVGEAGAGTLGILIVNNMLLTGFDAPVEQVMYLDRVIVAHNLLQTIARVNRVGEPHKEKGYIVDYVGVGHHLKKALEVYDEKEQQEVLGCLGNHDEEYKKLKEAHQNIINFFKEYGLEIYDEEDAINDFFYDDKARFDFLQYFKKFSKAFDIVLPKKEALDFVEDFKRLVEISYFAKQFSRDNRIGLGDLSKKLRAIADEHLVSKGVDQKIPPLSIMDDAFMSDVVKRKRAKTKAAEIEHAIRSYIEEHMDEDPELYKSFAELLEEILKQHENNWDMIYEEFKKLLEKIREEDNKPTYGLKRKKQMPFFRIFQSELFETKDLTDDQIGILVNLTQHITNLLERELKLSGFWESSRMTAQNRLKGEIQKLLLSKEFHVLPNIISKKNKLISRVMELAKKLNDEILYA
ncbi:MAG: HsdR family type I site-specific deoxyribonuclease [Bacteroidota bacterium]